MSDNKALIDQIETVMDKLIELATHMQRLASHVVDEDSMKDFLEKYRGMTQQLQEMESTIHRLGLDRNTPQFARIEAKLINFTNKSNAFLKERP